MTPFYGWGSTASRLEPLRADNLLLPLSSHKFLVLILPTSTGWKGWIDLGATQWFWTRHTWIGNPALYPLGHCSIRANVQKSYHIYTYHKTCFNRVLLNIFYSKRFSIKINQVLTFENIRKLCLNKTTLRCFYSCFDKTHL